MNKLLYLVLAGTLIFSCARREQTYTFLPQGYFLTGHLEDGRMMYLIPNDSVMMSGICFVYDRHAVVNEISYMADSSGEVVFLSEEPLQKGKLSVDKTRKQVQMSVPSLPGYGVGKQKIRLTHQPKTAVCLSCPERYREPLFEGIVSDRDVKYGSATGYYTSRSIDKIPSDDYVQIGKELVLQLKRTVFGKRTPQSLYMDIYRPAGDTCKQRPLFLFVHGGAFFFGDKETQTQQFLTEDLVKKGYVVISVNYRLGTTFKGVSAIENVIYRGVQDVRAALRYATFHSEALGIDPRRIYVGGNSAGAIIALAAAFMDHHEIYKSVNLKETGGLDASGNTLDADVRIAGIVSMWGGISDLKFIDNPVPVLLFHGTDDPIVRCDAGLPFKDVLGDFLHNLLASSWQLYGSASIYRYMNEQNIPVRYVPFNGYGHEPQTGKDGSFNRNMYHIRDEISGFLYDQQFREYTLEGRTEVRLPDTAPLYRVALANDETVQWRVEGGWIIESYRDAVKVVWYDTGRTGSVTACVTDETGVRHQREVTVRIRSL